MSRSKTLRRLLLLHEALEKMQTSQLAQAQKEFDRRNAVAAAVAAIANGDRDEARSFPASERSLHHALRLASVVEGARSVSEGRLKVLNRDALALRSRKETLGGKLRLTEREGVLRHARSALEESLVEAASRAISSRKPIV